ncbi:unnamed protein product [Coregonus sp. 'balchen']|nr:unnamed protein product [Coregonus sp. 'balchen']
MEMRHSPWKSIAAASGNGGLLGYGKSGPDTDFKQLLRPGSRGYGAFIPGGFRFKIRSGCNCAFVLCSVSLSGGSKLGFRSPELPPHWTVRYYLQVKKEVLDGRLHCTVEQGIRLAGLAVQADFGDFTQFLSQDFLREYVLFPVRQDRQEALLREGEGEGEMEGGRDELRGRKKEEEASCS